MAAGPACAVAHLSRDQSVNAAVLTTGVPRPAPSLDSLLHPLPLSALALMIANDHFLKPNYPGWWSGKLSDIAVMALLPFLLLASWDVLRLHVPRLRAPDLRMALVTVIMSMTMFMIIEVLPLGADVYRWGLGGAQWPFRALSALIASEPLPGLVPVQLTSDLSDLLTLPAALAVLVVRPWARAAALPSSVRAGAARRR